ncbi:MAG: acyl-CoA dehydrogenase family protein [Aeromicrobium sp.]
MELTWSADQEQYRTSVRAFLESRAPVARAREAAQGDVAFDRDVWAAMAGQLGAQSLAVPESLDGAGAGLAEQLIVLEELGRVLYSGPFLSTVISTALLTAADDRVAATYLPGIADGSVVVVVAEAEGGGFFDLSSLATTVTTLDGSLQVSGIKTYVLDAAAADVFLVTAQSPDGPVVVAVDARSDKVRVVEVQTLDRTRRLSTVTFDGAAGTLVAGAEMVSAVVKRARDTAIAGLGAEQLGAADRCLQMIVDYTSVREQFGRPVGSFQALKHRCADILTNVEAARSAVLYAAWAATDQPEDLGLAARVVGAHNSATLLQSAQECVQMHGGIGFTWEHDAHLYLRRAKSSHVLFGAPVDHRARLADLIQL